MYQILMITILALLVGCGKKSASDDFIFFDDKNQNLELALKEHSVSCENAKCPSGVGKILIQHDKSIGQCSGFLVENNIVMMSGHCIPKKSLQKFKNCTNLIAIKFPQTNEHPEAQAYCQEIVTYSQGKGKLDFVLFKIDHNIDRVPFKISQAALENFDFIESWAMNPISITHGHFVNKKCKVIRHSLVLPDNKSAYYPILSIADCNSIPGNSGAPLIDQNGAVRGILTGVFKEEYLKSITQAKPIFESSTTFIVGEAATCMDLRSLGLSRAHGQCYNFDLKKAYRVVPGNSFKSELKKLNLELQNLMLQDSNLHNFSTPVIQLGKVVTMSTLDQNQNLEIKLGYNRYLQEEASLNITPVRPSEVFDFK